MQDKNTLIKVLSDGLCRLVNDLQAIKSQLDGTMDTANCITAEDISGRTIEETAAAGQTDKTTMRKTEEESYPAIIDFETIRSCMVQLVKNGQGALVRSLLSKNGVERLSDLREENYKGVYDAMLLGKEID